MTALRALRLPHWIAIGAVVAVLAGGVPSKWFGLVGSKVSEVERLRSCMERHGAALASIVTTLGEPQAILARAPPLARTRFTSRSDTADCTGARAKPSSHARARSAADG